MAKWPDVVDLHDGPPDLRRLTFCLQKLGADQRGAVVLAYREGWSREERAQLYGRPISTIKTCLRRSLISLRQALEP